MNKIIELQESLSSFLSEIDVFNTDFIWIGLLINRKARKYKYEVYFFNSDNNLDEYVLGRKLNNSETFFDNCDVSFRENIGEAYSKSFYELRKFIYDNPSSKFFIKDLTEFE